MYNRNTKKYTPLLPRKPSKAFVNAFQSHCFNDNLRPSSHANKGKSWGHFQAD